MAHNTKLQYTAKVTQEGHFTLPARFYSEVGAAFAGKSITVEVERQRKRTTWEQHKYYRGCVLLHITDAINEQQGEALTPDEVHGYMAYRYLREQKVNEDGEIVFERVKSSGELTRFQYCVFVDECIRFAAEFLHIEIPTPHSVKDEFDVLEYQQQQETRQQYLQRVAEYLQDIFDRDGLRFYFRQNPEWDSDSEVKALFRQRLNEIEKG